MSPLPLCPTDRFKLTLKKDEPLDEEKRPTFSFYHASGREQRVTAVLFDELEATAKSSVSQDEVTAEQCMDRVLTIVREGLDQADTARRVEQLGAMIKSIRSEEKASTVDYIDKVFEVLRALLIDWTNVTRRNPEGGEPIAVAFDLEVVEDVMGYRQAQELVYAAWGYSPTAEDLGFCESQSSSDGDESAPTAPAESA